MSTAKTQPAPQGATNESLQTRYKPLGLRAVVAATQCKPEIKSADTNSKRDLPAVLQALHD